MNKIWYKKNGNKIPRIFLIINSSSRVTHPFLAERILSQELLVSFVFIPRPSASYLKPGRAMIVETSPLVISKVNHPSVWIDHYGLMRSEINGIESWHGIVPRKPGRNPSAYYGRTSKVDVASRLPADPLVSDFAKTRHAPVFLPEFRFDAFLREELQVLHGRCTKGLSIPRYLSRGRRD